MFNGKEVEHGKSVVAYISSSSPHNKECQKQLRVCDNGKLSGTYEYASCEKESTPCLFNGKTIAHGQRVKAAKNSSVNFGETCAYEDRVCMNGTLSGGYLYESCNVGAPKVCLFNGKAVPHEGTVKAYKTASVSYNEKCQEEVRKCINGALSGNYEYPSCATNVPRPCPFEGRMISHGDKVKAFKSATVKFNEKCDSIEERVCTDGTLSGSYAYGTCKVGGPATCSFHGLTVPHGGQQTAFEMKTAAYGKCKSQVITCNNGAWSGQYREKSCVQDCELNGTVVKNSTSITVYKTNNVPYGAKCESQSRTCHNGVLSGSDSYQSPVCKQGLPATCTDAYGKSIEHGKSGTVYTSKSVPYGQKCETAQRTCHNGKLNLNLGDSLTCAVEGCRIGFHVEGNECKPDTTSCFIPNGTGTKSWNSSSKSYGICNLVSCIEGYSKSGNVCMKSCNDVLGQTVLHGKMGKVFKKEVVPIGESCATTESKCDNGAFTLKNGTSLTCKNVDKNSYWKDDGSPVKEWCGGPEIPNHYEFTDTAAMKGAQWSYRSPINSNVYEWVEGSALIQPQINTLTGEKRRKILSEKCAVTNSIISTDSKPVSQIYKKNGQKGYGFFVKSSNLPTSMSYNITYYTENTGDFNFLPNSGKKQKTWTLTKDDFALTYDDFIRYGEWESDNPNDFKFQFFKLTPKSQILVDKFIAKMNEKLKPEGLFLCATNVKSTVSHGYFHSDIIVSRFPSETYDPKSGVSSIDTQNINYQISFGGVYGYKACPLNQTNAPKTKLINGYVK